MKRKILAFVMTICMLALTLAGCSTGGGSSQAASTGAPASTGQQSEAAAPAPASTAQASSGGEQAPAATAGDGEAFDAYPRPTVVSDGAIKVGCLIRNVSGEIHRRFLQQVEIEAAHRGWELVPIVYEVDTNFRDAFLNLQNQGVDAIIVGNADTFETKQDLVEGARNAGIGVYCIDNQVIPGIIVNTTMPNGVAAMEILYKMGEDSMWNLNYCAIVEEGILVTRERGNPVVGFQGAYPNFNILGTQDVAAAPTGVAQAGYDFASTWLQQYGDEMQAIFTISDYHSVPAVEAIIKNGDAHGDKCYVTGFDGGSQVWSYIRNNTPFKYTYSQAAELYAHATCEVLDQIQVQGLNPGESGCDIQKSGETLYFTGVVTTRENCPDVGESVHSVFDYYGGDPADQDAWYNWDDGPGIYMITDYDINQDLSE